MMSFYTVVSKDKLIYHFEPNVRGSKVAIFDLDHTLIRPKGGRTFPRGADDYEYLFPHTLATLRRLIQEGYSLYIVTNQGSLMNPKKHEALDDFLIKIQAIYADVPFSICIACGDGWYRKPHRGPITLFEDKLGIKIDRGLSFYCGDALGRRGDFAATDLYFAHNNGLRIYSPEGFFAESSSPSPREFTYHLPKRDYLDPLFDQPRGMAFLEEIQRWEKEGKPILIVLTGSPASGKTTLANFLKKQYQNIVASSDDFSTKVAMERFVQEKIQQRESIVVDATHPSRESRRKWIQMGQDAGYSVFSIYIPYQEEILEHMRHYRIEVGGYAGSGPEVPVVAMRVFKSRFERPTKAEGFDEVVEYVPFLEITDPQEEEMFMLYY